MINLFRRKHCCLQNYLVILFDYLKDCNVCLFLPTSQQQTTMYADVSVFVFCFFQFLIVITFGRDEMGDELSNTFFIWAVFVFLSGCPNGAFGGVCRRAVESRALRAHLWHLQAHNSHLWEAQGLWGKKAASSGILFLHQCHLDCDINSHNIFNMIFIPLHRNWPICTTRCTVHTAKWLRSCTRARDCSAPTSE